MLKNPAKPGKNSGGVQPDAEKKEFIGYLRQIFNSPHYLESGALDNIKKLIFEISGVERTNNISDFKLLITYMEKNKNVQQDNYIHAKPAGKK